MAAKSTFRVIGACRSVVTAVAPTDSAILTIVPKGDLISHLAGRDVGVRKSATEAPGLNARQVSPTMLGA